MNFAFITIILKFSFNILETGRQCFRPIYVNDLIVQETSYTYLFLNKRAEIRDKTIYDPLDTIKGWKVENIRLKTNEAELTAGMVSDGVQVIVRDKDSSGKRKAYITDNSLFGVIYSYKSRCFCLDVSRMGKFQFNIHIRTKNVMSPFSKITKEGVHEEEVIMSRSGGAVCEILSRNYRNYHQNSLDNVLSFSKAMVPKMERTIITTHNTGAEIKDLMGRFINPQICVIGLDKGIGYKYVSHPYSFRRKADIFIKGPEFTTSFDEFVELRKCSESADKTIQSCEYTAVSKEVVEEFVNKGRIYIKKCDNFMDVEIKFEFYDYTFQELVDYKKGVVGHFLELFDNVEKIDTVNLLSDYKLSDDFRKTKVMLSRDYSKKNEIYVRDSSNELTAFMDKIMHKLDGGYGNFTIIRTDRDSISSTLLYCHKIDNQNGIDSPVYVNSFMVVTTEDYDGKTPPVTMGSFNMDITDYVYVNEATTGFDFTRPGVYLVKTSTSPGLNLVTSTKTQNWFMINTKYVFAFAINNRVNVNNLRTIGPAYMQQPAPITVHTLKIFDFENKNEEFYESSDYILPNNANFQVDYMSICGDSANVILTFIKNYPGKETYKIVPSNQIYEDNLYSVNKNCWRITYKLRNIDYFDSISVEIGNINVEKMYIVTKSIYPNIPVSGSAAGADKYKQFKLKGGKNKAKKYVYVRSKEEIIEEKEKVIVKECKKEPVSLLKISLYYGVGMILVIIITVIICKVDWDKLRCMRAMTTVGIKNNPHRKMVNNTERHRMRSTKIDIRADNRGEKYSNYT